MVWTLLALTIALVPSLHQRLPLLSSDSFQYLSSADNLKHGLGFSTSLVHFDTERSHGTIPAPLTWFPPGYPAMIWLLMEGGIGGETAGLAISILAFALTSAGLFTLVTLLSPSIWAARFATLCWILNTHALLQADAVLSESLFTLLGLAVIMLLVATVGRLGRAKEVLWFCAAVCAGVSYCVRYAGLFWIAAFIVVLLLHYLGRKENRPTWRTTATSLVALALLTLPLMIRNVRLVGDWRGGNNTPIHVPLAAVAKSTPTLWFHLLLGNGTVEQNRVPLLLIAAGVLLCVARIVGGSSRTRRGDKLEGHDALRFGIVAVSALVYGGGIVLLALRSVIAYSPRMYVPTLPHLLALGACGLGYLAGKVPRSGSGNALGVGIVGFLLTGYVSSNARMLLAGVDDTFQKTEALLQEPGTGRAVKEFLQRLPPDTVLVATNGQATGYIAGKRTLSLVGSPYSKHEWNETSLRQAMQKFQSDYLVVFSQPDLDTVILDSAVLRELSAGKAPVWLDIVEQNAAVRVYRLAAR